MARWVAVGLGMSLGLIAFLFGVPTALMVLPFGNSPEGTYHLLSLVACLSFLPLSVLGAFMPRVAGFGIAVMSGLWEVSCLVASLPNSRPPDALGVAALAFPFVLSALFLYSSCERTAGGLTSGDGRSAGRTPDPDDR